MSLGIHASLGEQLREAELCEVARQLAAALAHCHRYGVAHLDVKPDNIYLQVAWVGGWVGVVAGREEGVLWGRC